MDSVADDEMNKFMKFMKCYHASSPLTTKALKIVRRRLGYDIYYISAKESERSAKRVPYSPPKKGGNFKLKKDDFLKFPFLSESRFDGELITHH